MNWFSYIRHLVVRAYAKLALCEPVSFYDEFIRHKLVIATKLRYCVKCGRIYTFYLCNNFWNIKKMTPIKIIACLPKGFTLKEHIAHPVNVLEGVEVACGIAFRFSSAPFTGSET